MGGGRFDDDLTDRHWQLLLENEAGNSPGASETRTVSGNELLRAREEKGQDR